MRSHLWECLETEGLSRGSLDVLLAHSGQLENYSDDLIWRLDRVGSYTDDILKLVDDYGEAFTRELNADDLRRLGRLVNEGLSDDVVDAVIRHVDYFVGYSDDAIKKIAESGCNAERILTQMDNYAKDFTEDLTAGQLKRLDDILEQGITQEQFEVLLKHGKQLDDYTDEIVTLWRSYEGNSDDFLKLVDEFGDEFVEAFQENGDEAVERFKGLLEGGLKSEIIIRPIDEVLDSSILNKIEQRRQLLPSALKNTPNAGFADVDIEGLTKTEFFAHSGVKKLEDLSDVVQNRLGDISPEATNPEFQTLYVNNQNVVNGEGAWNRIVDAESKILEDINVQLANIDNPCGKIKLYTDLKPCPSCESVIEQFRQRYPNVEIEIIYTK